MSIRFLFIFVFVSLALGASGTKQLEVLKLVDHISSHHHHDTEKEERQEHQVELLNLLQFMSVFQTINEVVLFSINNYSCPSYFTAPHFHLQIYTSGIFRPPIC